MIKGRKTIAAHDPDHIQDNQSERAKVESWRLHILMEAGLFG